MVHCIGNGHASVITHRSHAYDQLAAGAVGWLAALMTTIATGVPRSNGIRVQTRRSARQIDRFFERRRGDACLTGISPRSKNHSVLRGRISKLHANTGQVLWRSG